MPIELSLPVGGHGHAKGIGLDLARHLPRSRIKTPVCETILAQFGGIQEPRDMKISGRYSTAPKRRQLHRHLEGQAKKAQEHYWRHWSGGRRLPDIVPKGCGYRHWSSRNAITQKLMSVAISTSLERPAPASKTPRTGWPELSRPSTSKSAGAEVTMLCAEPMKPLTTFSWRPTRNCPR